MAKDYAKSFYSGKTWRDTQAAFMSSKHYLCERCGDMARVVHHRVYITPQNIHNPAITLDWSNLEALCMDCHNAEHGSGAACARGLEFDDAGNMIRNPNCFLICGAPGSGKSTYVRETKTARDLVVDLDYIGAALMGDMEGIHNDRSFILPVALEVRDTVYKCIKSRVGKWQRAFVITTQANINEIYRIAKDLSAEICFMNTARDECIARIVNDDSRNNKDLFIALVDKWYNEHERSRVGTPPPY